jgi:hypothetical protein
MKTIEERVKDLCKVPFVTLDEPDTIQPECSAAISYENGEWFIWLTDSPGSSHTASAYRHENGEIMEGELIVGMGYDPNWGDCSNIFGDNGKTLEEAVDKLEKKVAILREHPDCVLLFTWDD